MRSIQMLNWLSDEQELALGHLQERHKAIVWWKIGEGKTRVALAWMLDISDPVIPLIVCSPQANRQWMDEIALVGLEGRIKPVFLSCGMLSRKNAISVLNRLLERSDVHCVVLDELWLYKNPRSHRSLAAQQLSRDYYIIGLSGSMITARNIEDLYGQSCAVGLGDKIATSLTNFRSQFCIEVTNYAGFIERTPKRGAVETIQERLKQHIHVYFPKEVREIRDIPVRLDATPEQTQLRKQLIKEYYLEIRNTNNEQERFQLEIKNGASLLIKLQQISDGFLRDSGGNYISIKSNKLHRLIQHISELLDAGERVLVWFGFRQSIKETLKLSKFPTTLLYSGEAFDVNKWSTGKARVCYATVGSGASLNDFSHTRYAIIYSSSYSFRAFEQAKGRTNRKSSKHSICYYYLYETLDFPDGKVYRMLEESKTIQEYVIEATRKIVDEYLTEEKIQSTVQV
jgi:hydroxymethylpyrimidine pyrophosphatase-like HAD family hydrolase